MPFVVEIFIVVLSDVFNDDLGDFQSGQVSPMDCRPIPASGVLPAEIPLVFENRPGQSLILLVATPHPRIGIRPSKVRIAPPGSPFGLNFLWLDLIVRKGTDSLGNDLMQFLFAHLLNNVG